MHLFRWNSLQSYKIHRFIVWIWWIDYTVKLIHSDKWQCGTMRLLEYDNALYTYTFNCRLFTRVAEAHTMTNLTSNSTFSINFDENLWINAGKYTHWIDNISVLCSIQGLWKGKVNKMSRFFATGGSDSESDSDSEREQIVQRPAPAQFTVIFLCNIQYSSGF